MLTQARLKELLAYDPETGIFTNAKHRSSTSRRGDAVGTPHSGGYLRTRIDGTDYFLHRLVWIYMYGVVPVGIDHRDGDRKNNSLANLRHATQAENTQNAAIGKNNTSGFRGVHKAGNATWYATLSVGGRQRHIGTFNSAEQASEAYLAAKAASHSFQPIPRERLSLTSII